MGPTHHRSAQPARKAGRGKSCCMCVNGKLHLADACGAIVPFALWVAVMLAYVDVYRDIAASPSSHQQVHGGEQINNRKAAGADLLR
jgi:hypothetical protein